MLLCQTLSRMLVHSLRNPYVISCVLVLDRSLNGVWLVISSPKLLFSLKTTAISKIQNLKHQEIFQSSDLLLHGMVVVPCYIYHIPDGYDIVKTFYNKFTHISPCWFQIRRYKCLLYLIQEFRWIYLCCRRSGCGSGLDSKYQIQMRGSLSSHRSSICMGSRKVRMECKCFRNVEGQDLSSLSSVIADSLNQYQFDGFVFELGFADSILPILYDLRETIEEKEMILVVHPQSCISDFFP